METFATNERKQRCFQWMKKMKPNDEAACSVSLKSIRKCTMIWNERCSSRKLVSIFNLLVLALVLGCLGIPHFGHQFWTYQAVTWSQLQIKAVLYIAFAPIIYAFVFYYSIGSASIQTSYQVWQTVHRCRKFRMEKQGSHVLYPHQTHVHLTQMGKS